MRKLQVGLICALLVGAVSLPAQAAGIQFAGATIGSFDGGAPGAAVSLDSLSYLGGAFDVETAAGVANVGGTATDNFGAFSLDASNFVYTGHTFELFVFFAIPADATPNPAQADANLIGTVTTTGAGGVRIDFDNTPILLSSATIGNFTLAVNDLDLTPGQFLFVSGRITAVPEPASAALFGLGVFGIGLARRKVAL